jgi:cyanophycinase
LSAAKVDEKPVVGPESGYLVISGGVPTRQIMERFIELAGGKDANFVVVPTAEQGGPTSRGVDLLHRFGAKHVTMLHTTKREVADSDAFVAPLKTTNAVWFTGGHQAALADAYLGTKTLKEFFAVLDRGGVIGGASAGATIMGSYLVRGLSENNTVLMEPGHEVAFGFLKNVGIDQHIDARSREGGMQKILSVYPNLLGIGLDENAGIMVHGDHMEVIGGARVEITDINHPVDKHGNHYYFLHHGDKFNLRTREVENR